MIRYEVPLRKGRRTPRSPKSALATFCIRRGHTSATSPIFAAMSVSTTLEPDRRPAATSTNPESPLPLRLSVALGSLHWRRSPSNTSIVLRMAMPGWTSSVWRRLEKLADEIFIPHIPPRMLKGARTRLSPRETKRGLRLRGRRRSRSDFT